MRKPNDRSIKTKDGFVMNWKSYPDMQDLWIEKRKFLMDKEFISELEAFDIRTLTKSRIQLVRKILERDPYMNFDLIKAESVMCAHLFNWVLAILEFHDIFNRMKGLGIKQLKDQIQHKERIIQTAQQLAAKFDK